MLAPLEVALERLFEHFREFSRGTCFVCVVLGGFQLPNRPMKRLELLHFLAAHRMRERTSNHPVVPVLAPSATPAPPRTHSPAPAEEGRRVPCRRVERCLIWTRLGIKLI